MTAAHRPAAGGPLRALLVDDGETYDAALRAGLPEVALLSPRAGDGPAALERLAREAAAGTPVELVLLDLNFDVPESRLLPLGPGATPRQLRRAQGVAILRAIRARHPEVPVILLTAAEEIPFADLRAELGRQPLTWMLGGDDLDTLRIRIHEVVASRALGEREGGVFWGRDPGMAAVRRRLGVLARGRMTVILEGETGTGKSFVAERWIHAQSGRHGPFLAADLSTLPADLVPAFLFGATRGAYTGAVADRKGVFELADGGTLFLDEIQSLAPEVQRQLLLVLQDRRVRPLGASRDLPVDVKVIAASNVSLPEAVAAGRFRADLYMRLGPATRVVLPPLRARPGDLPDLARHFIERATDDPDVKALVSQVAQGVGLSPGAPLRLQPGRGARAARAGAEELVLALPPPVWASLLAHRWPGNVRELATVVQNMAIFTLVAAADALHAGVRLRAPRLQVDAGLVEELLAGSLPPELSDPPAGPSEPRGGPPPEPRPRPAAEEIAPELAPEPAGPPPPSARDPQAFSVQVRPAETLNAVAVEVERQYFTVLFRETQGDFGAMAARLLGDPEKARAIRLRFNQLGLSARALRGGG